MRLTPKQLEVLRLVALGDAYALSPRNSSRTNTLVSLARRGLIIAGDGRWLLTLAGEREKARRVG